MKDPVFTDKTGGDGGAVEADETFYYGAVLGAPYAWFKGASQPYFKIRDIATGDLVSCYYQNEDYDCIASLFAKRNSLVYVHGMIRLDVIKEKFEFVHADRFEVAPEFSDEDYEKFFGCAPNFTGGEATTDFIRKIRSDG